MTTFKSLHILTYTWVIHEFYMFFILFVYLFNIYNCSRAFYLSWTVQLATNLQKNPPVPAYSLFFLSIFCTFEPFQALSVPPLTHLYTLHDNWGTRMQRQYYKTFTNAQEGNTMHWEREWRCVNCSYFVYIYIYIHTHTHTHTHIYLI